MKKIIKFMIFGLTNVIPGVCSATIALILGIYDEVLDCIINVFNIRKWKDNLCFYLSIVIGLLVGIICLNTLSKICPFILNICFLAIVIKSYPLKLNKEFKFSFLPFFIGFLIVILVSLINLYVIDIDYSKFNLKFFIFIIINSCLVALGMILPGISGALMMVSFGLYFPLLKGINDLILFVISNCPFNLNSFILVITFFICFISSIILFSLIIKKFIKVNSIKFNNFINGMVLGTIITLFINLIDCDYKFIDVVIGISLFIVINFLPKSKNKSLLVEKNDVL